MVSREKRWNADRVNEWLACPECGFDDFDTNVLPPRAPGHNSYFECPECGHPGKVVG